MTKTDWSDVGYRLKNSEGQWSSGTEVILCHNKSPHDIAGYVGEVEVQHRATGEVFTTMSTNLILRRYR